MSATQIKDISDYLKTLAEGIVETSEFDGFKQVFDYMMDMEEIEGTPILVITPSNLETEFTTNYENQRIWTYDLSIFVHIDDNSSKESLENIMKYSSGTLIHEIEKNWNFSNGNKIEIGIANWSQDKGDYLISRIEVRVHVLTDITI